MSKSVILKIGDGDFDRGFPITLRIEEEDTYIDEIDGQLPPALMIPQQYDDWKSAYNDRGLGSYRKLEPVEAEITHISIQDSAADLQTSLNQWLDSSLDDKAKPLREKLLDNLDKKDTIRFFIQTENQILNRLPWQVCELFSRYPHACVDLFVNPKTTTILSNPLKKKIKILVILGDSVDLDVQTDLTLLQENLPDAYILPIIAPTRDKLNNKLWEQDWDILFFAGHSSTKLGDGAGYFYINQTEIITIADLKFALRNAIDKGLKLAIFNSCDGLGLAQDLAELQMPAIIVMRERVPDEAAQRFLEYFLKAFAQERKLLHISVEEARKRLHGLEGLYPCVSWLPVLCQHPSASPLTWVGMREIKKPEQLKLPLLQRLQIGLLASILVTGLVMGMRSLGLLQAWELKAFDQLMQLRLPEGRDSRILIIEITEDDLQLPEQQNRKDSLADPALDKLLQKLDEYQPRGIGLMIFRDAPIDAQLGKLKERFQEDNRFFAICNARGLGSHSQERGIARPPELPKERQGFDNILRDPDGVVRRHLLSMKVSVTSHCSADSSISLALAVRYLELEPKTISPLDFNQDGNLQLGDVVFNSLKGSTGAYQKVDTRGTQVILNYRSPENIAETVSLADVFAGKLNSEIVKDQIILIGARHTTSKYLRTPNSEKMSAVMFQAQMVSQIISAVLNQRPLITFWSWWREILWVWGWSLVGGMVVLGWRFKRYQGLVGVVSLGVLYGLCYYFITKGYWLPFVPSVLGIVATSVLVSTYLKWQKR